MKNSKLMILLLAILIPTIISTKPFGNKLDAYSLQKLSSLTQSDKTVPTLASVQNFPFKQIGNKIFVSMLLELSSKDRGTELANLGVKINSTVDNILSVDVPLEQVERILSLDFVLRASVQRKYKFNLDSSRKSIKADLVHRGISLPSAFNGGGVIVGIFDTGIDWQHPDFSDENGTRVLYLWDMSDQSGMGHPSGYDWGREYTKEQIDSSPENVFEKDYNGHGTHVAGIAAGNGGGKENFTGIAPKADIIFVKGVREPMAAEFTDGDIIAGCNYIFQKANQLGKPCVINLSLGTSFGPHDGEDLLSKALSNLVEEKPGRVIVAAAGNSGSFPIHSGGTILGGERNELVIFPFNICSVLPEMCPDLPNYFLTGADIWSDPDVIDSVYVGIYSSLSAQFISEVGFAVGDGAKKVQMFDSDNQLAGIISFSFANTTSADNVLIFISNEGDSNILVDNYLWSVVLTSKNSGYIDSWAGIPIGSQTPFPSRFERFPSDNRMSIGSPAAGKSIISVGSYNSKNKFVNIQGTEIDISSAYILNDISTFSSRGPTRDGRIVPTVLAPGAFIFSSMSGFVPLEKVDSTLLEPSGLYVGMEGTSMAAPHVTGAVALLFQQSPQLGFSQVVQLLKNSAKTDVYTGDIPNNDAGWGKLDVLRLLQLVTSVESPEETDYLIEVAPNPTLNKVGVASLFEITKLEVLNLLGYKMLEAKGTNELDLSGFPTGVYVVAIYTARGKFHRIIMKL